MIRLFGLRTRLLIAFGLLSVVTAAAVAGVSYVQARNLVLQQSQDASVRATTTRLETLYPLRNPAPGPVELGEIADVVRDRNTSAIAFCGDERSRDDFPVQLIPADLRREVDRGKIVWQRIRPRGVPILVTGVPLMVVNADGSVQPSGIQVYTVRDLMAEEEDIGSLAIQSWGIGGAALGLAVVLALFAARGVLRPVRELSDAAQRLGSGDLETRISVRGNDELAQVARTFNETAAELERHVTQLREMKAEAQRFVADVSHELRTPLAAVTPVTDMLDEDADRLPDELGAAARLVSQEIHNLGRLVNDLIEISRFDSGTAALTLDEVDLAALVRATLRTRGWTDQVDADLPEVTAVVDPRRVDVVVANLVGNALRHGAAPVSVRLRADEDWATVEVRDSGPGLDPEVLPHVFARFYKADVARARSEGSGLGLAIARENAALHRDGEHRGDLFAANDPAGGAVFTLRLPRRARNGGGQ
ncbi:two-component system, OmpR family, sensor histidine kinase MtrB [Saccharopolyspora kobensis]|uniref:histidine kinase n=1 Tax=Saccharopolyspora kobensis TaxID=146035 RepID=A0A1H5ZTE4_9PSEU|nr:two-component system, OmpR family, sensor histidine kinase MtrB [Saccharopolyspora kobensis]SFE14305.1 two-component system, OmpR family, sensor histidine kinase MtrB [Saccharopolyspora kobensis]